MFATFGDFGGDPAPTLGSPASTLRVLYGGSRPDEVAHDPTTWFRADARDGVQGFFAVGNDDPGFLSQEERVATIAGRDGMRVHLDIIPGGHTFRTWANALHDSYPWIVSRFEQAGRRPRTHLVRAHQERKTPFGRRDPGAGQG